MPPGSVYVDDGGECASRQEERLRDVCKVSPNWVNDATRIGRFRQKDVWQPLFPDALFQVDGIQSLLYRSPTPNSCLPIV